MNNINTKSAFTFALAGMITYGIIFFAVNCVTLTFLINAYSEPTHIPHMTMLLVELGILGLLFACSLAIAIKTRSFFWTSLPRTSMAGFVIAILISTFVATRPSKVLSHTHEVQNRFVMLEVKNPGLGSFGESRKVRIRNDKPMPELYDSARRMTSTRYHWQADDNHYLESAIYAAMIFLFLFVPKFAWPAVANDD